MGELGAGSWELGAFCTQSLVDYLSICWISQRFPLPRSPALPPAPPHAKSGGAFLLLRQATKKKKKKKKTRQNSRKNQCCGNPSADAIFLCEKLTNKHTLTNTQTSVANENARARIQFVEKKMVLDEWLRRVGL